LRTFPGHVNLTGKLTVADDHLAEIGPADFDAWDREHGIELLEQAQALPDAAREAHLLRWASRPSVSFMISLRAHGLPGAEFARDATTAASVAIRRRTVHAYQSVGLNGRATERNLRLLDRICSLVGEWPEPEWSETVRRHVEGFGEARRRGRERGQQSRNARGERDRAPAPKIPSMLCHPNDHWFRHARPSITDPEIAAVVDEWIAEFAPSYATLAGEDWSAEEASADLVVDIQIPDEEPKGLKDSLSTLVVAEPQNKVETGSELIMHRVPPEQEQFNGHLVATLPRERWRACASLRADGSILPGDGTRRLEPSTT